MASTSYEAMTKVEMAKEMVARKMIGSASIFTPGSLRWDVDKGDWTGQIDYGPYGIGRFTREFMVACLESGHWLTHM